MNELQWIAAARRHIGLREDTSKNTHSPVILAMLGDMGKFSNEARAWYRDDETPWCGLFVGHCLGVSGRYVVKEWYRALAWHAPVQLSQLSRPAYGAIVTFTRDGGGHVGFIVGKDARGNLMVLGGNQSNSVSIAPFAVSRATGFFWPSMWSGGSLMKSVPLEERYNLPLLESNGKLSTNES